MWEMPAAGSSFHWSIAEDNARDGDVVDLKALTGGTGFPRSILPVSEPDLEGEAGGDGDGSVHHD